MGGLKHTVEIYIQRLRSFRFNARLYLISLLMSGATMGVFRLIFNFYVLSLGYDEALVGRLISVTQFTGLFLALPVGYLAARIGSKPVLMSQSVLLATSIGLMALFPSVTIFYLMNALLGVVMSISAVVTAPFLMQNSGPQERTYLFSFSSGLRMGSVFVGNWLGGYLPLWMAQARGVLPTSSDAYAGALLATTGIAVFGFVPMSLIRSSKRDYTRTNSFAPFRFLAREPKLMAKLLLPSLIISIGAGFFMPFMNIFFRQVHHQPDYVIGTIFAWGSLAMGIGLIVAPPLADRLGKIRLVTLTQGLSIPFMILLGFAPWFAVSTVAYYVRIVLMNMSNPIYQTFVMESVDDDARTTVASLASMVERFGRAFSPSLSGALQVQYGFAPPFAIAITLYSISVGLYWLFFLRQKQDTVRPVVA